MFSCGKCYKFSIKCLPFMMTGSSLLPDFISKSEQMEVKECPEEEDMYHSFGKQ